MSRRKERLLRLQGNTLRCCWGRDVALFLAVVCQKEELWTGGHLLIGSLVAKPSRHWVVMRRAYWPLHSRSRYHWWEIQSGLIRGGGCRFRKGKAQARPLDKWWKAFSAAHLLQGSRLWVSPPSPRAGPTAMKKSKGQPASGWAAGPLWGSCSQEGGD